MLFLSPKNQYQNWLFQEMLRKNLLRLPKKTTFAATNTRPV